MNEGRKVKDGRENGRKRRIEERDLREGVEKYIRGEIVTSKCDLRAHFRASSLVPSQVWNYNFQKVLCHFFLNLFRNFI